MRTLFKPIGASLCLVFALSFAAPNAHADSFTYTYTNTLFGFSWTTAAISGVTMETTVSAAGLTAASTSGFATGCVITSVVLDGGGVGGTRTNVSGCGSSPDITSRDTFALTDYSTPGTHVSPFIRFDTLVVTAVITPEPSSLVLMLSGVGLVFAMRKRPRDCNRLVESLAAERRRIAG